MNSGMYPAMSGRFGRSCGQFKLSGLFALFVVAALSLAGCGKGAKKTGANAALGSESGHNKRQSEAHLEDMFKASDESVLSIVDEKGFKQVKPIGNVHLTAAADNLKIEATNNDPSVHLPKFSGGHDIVEVSVESPATTEMQLFYLLPGQKSFTQPQSEKRTLKAGHNIAYFELPDPSWTGVLRLDPGMVPGVYLINSIKVKTAPAGGVK